MPAGVEVEVADGFATIDFVDRTLRAPGLTALLAVGGPETIETLTGGVRRVYRVPEGNARAAGLLDEAPTPSGVPDGSWSRAALNEHAASIGVEEPEKLRSKDAVLDAITQHSG